MDDEWMMVYAVIGGGPRGWTRALRGGWASGRAGGRKQRARLECVGGYVLSQTLVVAADIENPDLSSSIAHHWRCLFTFSPARGERAVSKASLSV
ncbi:unnamed protein product [Sphagnum balticum]